MTATEISIDLATAEEAERRLSEAYRVIAQYERTLRDHGNDTQADAVRRHQRQNSAALNELRRAMLKAGVKLDP